MKWLDVSEPAVLANFFAFCKTSSSGRGRSIFLRGQGRWHSNMVPSLFRSVTFVPERTRRWAAYREFLQQLPILVRGTRFTRRNFGAVLQHYGFRTPRLDVVDDLHAAIWFALHDFEKVRLRCLYEPTKRDYGWIALIAARPGGHVQNLLQEQSSRNTRCNVQQGYSLAMQYDDARKPAAEQDFIDNVIGMVRIPTCERWQSQGFRGSGEYFFPPSDYDDTYRQLLNPSVATMAARAEEAYGRDEGALGRVIRYH
jgi:hypothetical protein